MNLHLVRHGKTSSNVAKVYQGRGHKSLLTPEGHAQARALALALPRLGMLCSSPSLRATQTAAPMASASCVPVREEALLEELDYGALVGTSYAALPAGYANVYQYIFDGDDPHLHAAVREGMRRALALLEALREGAYQGAREVAFVSHGSFLHILTCRMLARKLRYDPAIFLDNGEHHTILLERGEVVGSRLRVLPRAH